MKRERAKKPSAVATANPVVLTSGTAVGISLTKDDGVKLPTFDWVMPKSPNCPGEVEGDVLGLGGSPVEYTWALATMPTATAAKTATGIVDFLFIVLICNCTLRVFSPGTPLMSSIH